jgi:hypothetical protein
MSCGVIHVGHLGGHGQLRWDRLGRIKRKHLHFAPSIPYQP